ncbi:MAG: cytochrome c oxidase subunit II [Actinobacteria bacterium]|nr:cytochrome c oxidase subunit II [Actinomycetota bacterium]
MIQRRPVGKWIRTGALLAGALLLFVACAKNAPQDTLQPKGPIAERENDLFQPVFWIAVGVFVFVEGLILLIMVKFRHRKGHDRIPTQVHGNKALELGWTIAPTILLAGIAIPTIGTIFSLSKEPLPANRLDVRIVAHQWWWEVEYPDAKVITANEIHIPTGKPVYFTLEARNANPQEIPVIHSFWVPALGGKQDVVPGRINHVTLEATEPGTYLGQCAEFCGISHAYMRLLTIAHTPEEFDAWLQQESAAAAEPTDALASQGLELFQNPQTCMACHAIKGVENAEAQVGPDLTHFGSRTTFAGATIELTEENLAQWLDDPSSLKPGAKMPDYGLSPDEIRALVAYLMSLQ